MAGRPTDGGFSLPSRVWWCREFRRAGPLKDATTAARANPSRLATRLYLTCPVLTAANHSPTTKAARISPIGFCFCFFSFSEGVRRDGRGSRRGQRLSILL